MVDLDDLEVLQVDRSGMLDLLLDLPEHMQVGERLGQSVDLPSGVDVRAIVVTGMGGSSISGDLLRSYIHAECPIPLLVNRHYSLPAFVGPETLVCAASFSGNTEETLSAFGEARARGARLLAVTSGGQLAQLADEWQIPCVRVPEGLPPRTTVGYLFTPMLVTLARLGLIADQSAPLAEAIEVLRELGAQYRPGIETFRNLPKALAKDLHGKFPVIYGVQDLSDVIAYRWRTQFNENSKVLASHQAFPELNHNELVGWQGPLTSALEPWVVLLRDPQELGRIRLQIDITKAFLQERAAGLTEVWSQGHSRLARLFSLLYTGDFTSYYLALLRGVDPKPVEAIDRLKHRLASS
ncbi:MAG TPA: bifunctional phosphoglucose/phosphomannose isomerase [Candidatus Tectomicrobia bacterium]|nr:bifunctional phosphoglucose/phosphomannose isomerase [Candidatus Tectomicrobia bacterium]